MRAVSGAGALGQAQPRARRGPVHFRCLDFESRVCRVLGRRAFERGALGDGGISGAQLARFPNRRDSGTSRETDEMLSRGVSKTRRECRYCRWGADLDFADASLRVRVTCRECVGRHLGRHVSTNPRECVKGM